VGSGEKISRGRTIGKAAGAAPATPELSLKPEERERRRSARAFADPPFAPARSSGGSAIGAETDELAPMPIVAADKLV